MWTPKRVLLLAAGFAVFFLGYLGYAHVLGGIDGLPPLPAALLPVPGNGPRPILDTVTHSASSAEEMLQKAFGAGAPEPKRRYTFGSSTRGFALAFDRYSFEKDGRIRLEPIGLALYGKTVPGKFPEINTLRADFAYLTLDRPIVGINDINSRKLVAAELGGDGIRIVHNRKTPQQDDDIDILIRKGIVYFDDAKRLITTNNDVLLEDMQSKPKPMQVTATGLDVHLGAGVAAPAGKNAPRPAGAEKSGAVERIVLRSNVDMHLYVSPGSGFPGTGRDERKIKEEAERLAKAGTPPAKDHVHIHTAGAFHYDIVANTARFDIPENPARRFPERVVVTRTPEPDGKKDTLDCEHLELQLRRRDADKPAAAKAPADKAGDETVPEIETAHATGKEVVIASEAELLDASGNDLFYDGRTRQTTLKGDPEMWLMKEGNEIHARELELVNQTGVQTVSGRGPGRVHLLDKGGKRFHARWKEKFTSARDGAYDLLTFTGGAAFAEDDKNLDPRDVLDDEKLLRARTLLKADTLQVWMEPRKPAPAKADAKADAGNGPKPRHVEARGNVLARGPEMHVHDTQHLVILFKEAPETLPAVPAAPAKPAGEAAFPAKPDAAAPPAAPPPAADAPATPPRPIDLSARYVKAYVLRSGPRNDLDRLHTEGAVHVVQAPAGPDDKGVDIRGASLDLERKAGGNVLVVRGSASLQDPKVDADLAELRIDKIYIMANEINIDQSINRAWVDGRGLMELESKVDFQGNALTKAVPLQVLWDRTMDFNGSSVEFHGSVQAWQAQALLKCETLHVYLQPAVSLRDGARTKDGPPPHARKLTADSSVSVEEKTFDPQTGQLTGFHRLDCLELNAFPEEKQVRAKGPGWVRLAQVGGDVAPAAAPRPPAPAPGKPPGAWHLTLVRYAELMRTDNARRTATFDDSVHGSVKVLHVPWAREKYSAAIDVEKVIEELPADGLYMACNGLTVYSGQGKTGKARTFDAEGHVTIKAVDAKGQIYHGVAEEVHFDEEKDQVILDGKGGNATLSVVERKGAPPKKVVGKKITHVRKTGEVTVDGVTEIRGTN